HAERNDVEITICEHPLKKWRNFSWDGMERCRLYSVKEGLMMGIKKEGGLFPAAFFYMCKIFY
ncbi:MAG: hypothetical protein JXB23_12410, partial [Candidatus Aminicenantes bacterium]|nr:hypothetical protein [Candidatus Aminicenantes bacterium]